MPIKKKVTKLQLAVLDGYIAASKSCFTKSVYATVKKKAAALKYEDEFEALRGYMLAKVKEEFKHQVIDLFNYLVKLVL